MMFPVRMLYCNRTNRFHNVNIRFISREYRSCPNTYRFVQTISHLLL